MPKNNFKFDPESHVYTLEEIKLPSVTEIIQVAFQSDFSHVSEDIMDRSREYGNAVHEATALRDHNALDIFDLDSNLANPLNAWLRFRDDYQFKPEIIEVPMFSEKYKFAGTPDRIGKIGKDNVLVDIKTGVPSLAEELQTAGYSILSPVKRRLVVQISQDGTYKVREFKERGDVTVFLSCLNVYNYLKRRGK